MAMSKTKLMGIVNITPDSFYKPSRTYALDASIARALQLASEGADILDIGGESTRPGASPVSEEEEIKRVIPFLKNIKGKISIPISIDTKKPAVARAAMQAGASLINDVSGFSQPKMISVAAEADAEIYVMHMQGTPETMQLNPQYEGGVVPFLLRWFEDKVNMLIHSGIRPENIILDPGIGFGKTVADNLEIIHNLSEFKRLGFRVLLGLSRKSFLSKILSKPAEELLSATLAANTLAIMSNVDFIRVHDVKEHRSLIDVIEAFKSHDYSSKTFFKQTACI